MKKGANAVYQWKKVPIAKYLPPGTKRCSRTLSKKMAAQPYTLSRPDQFRSPSPPAISSSAYTRAFEEVKTYGRYESKLRTLNQTHLAMWWKDFVENSHNRLARRLVVREDLGLWAGA